MDNEKPYRNLLAAMEEQAGQDTQFLHYANKTMEELNLYNSLYAEFVVELTEILAQHALYQGDETASDMEIDEKYGKGINIYCILRALADYEETDEDTCLDAILVLIMREKERLILCEQD